jgi:outer membrane receptor protein involved in Fe transport
MGRWAGLLLGNTQISLYINNVFNTLPPFDYSYPPFYISPYGDPELRNYTLSVRKSF